MAAGLDPSSSLRWKGELGDLGDLGDLWGSGLRRHLRPGVRFPAGGQFQPRQVPAVQLPQRVPSHQCALGGLRSQVLESRSSWRVERLLGLHIHSSCITVSERGCPVNSLTMLMQLHTQTCRESEFRLTQIVRGTSLSGCHP